MEAWPHQIRGVVEVLAAIVRGERKILLTSPTGMGKTWMACDLIQRWVEDGLKVALYTNRRLLIEQTSRVMAAAGIEHGRRVAGYWEGELSRQVQVCSVQTEGARSIRSSRWELHDADRVLIDEAHLQTGPTMRKILDAHIQHGAHYIGLTATPIGLAGLYETLIQAGTVSEGRKCGALVPARHYGPDEPDLRHVGRVSLGEDLSESQNVKAVMVPGIFGRVHEWLLRLNPELLPAVLFGPDVAGSLFFAEELTKAGVRAAHIDGESVWIDGEFYRSDRKARDEVLEGSRLGMIKVLCNRFVLREGVDTPWIRHMILATVIGSLQSFLQIIGRGLRAYEGKEFVTVQDHGGSWWRHGSANEDRWWRLNDTASGLSGVRADDLRNGRKPQPARCPSCAKILFGWRCPCGWESKPGLRSRPVIQADGSLLEMRGDIFKPRRTESRGDTVKIWTKVYYRARNSKRGMTFKQAETLFVRENGYWPPHTLPMMPVRELDWYLKVSDVPRERLISGGKE